jgi:predicted O-methyltransferase YrrM
LTNRYEFLTELHRILKPKIYLEIGVQHGWSFDLSSAAEVAIGIDPQPLTTPHDNQVIMRMTSDDYFDRYDPEPIDFAFIDGMHLHEYALRDFINVESHCNSDAVVAFDDVLPRNQQEASRIQCPGDWAGDVWKVYYLLQRNRPDLRLILVDTFPTGILLAMNLHPDNALMYQDIEWGGDDLVPTEIFLRANAISPQLTLGVLQERYGVSS